MIDRHEVVLSVIRDRFVAIVSRTIGDGIQQYSISVYNHRESSCVIRGKPQYTLLEAKAELLRIIDEITDELTNIAEEIQEG